MSQLVHLTFREHEPISLQAIFVARRNLLRERAPMIRDWLVPAYYLMQVHPEHEYALRDMRDYFQPALRYPTGTKLLDNEIGGILGFRVVVGL